MKFTARQIAGHTVTDIGSGVLLAWALTYWVLPLWGYQYTGAQSAGITALYTGVSLTRSYFWRLFFERGRNA